MILMIMMFHINDPNEYDIDVECEAMSVIFRQSSRPYTNPNYIQISWAQARKKCISQNAELISIRSQRGMNVVMDLMRIHGREGIWNIWTGGNDINSEGSFSWSDDDGNNQDCVSIPIFAPGQLGKPSKLEQNSHFQ